MEIRSVTCFVEQTWPLDERLLARAGMLGEAARTSFARAGLHVQTVRLATQPFSRILKGQSPQTTLELVSTLETVCQAHSLDYCSLGPLFAPELRDEVVNWAEVVPHVIQATDRVFISIQVATQQTGIIPEAVRCAAGIIKDISEMTHQGFGNLRFAALANCPPGSPFFPVAYHGGGSPSLAIATESADLATVAFAKADGWDKCRERLIQAIESQARQITAVAEELAIEHGFRFGGVDFSLAPFPEADKSIGEAIEQMTGVNFGEHGTLFGVATLTDCLREARFHRCGFSGVMLPVLEDAILARRSSDHTYDLNSLLLYSAVCGTGLDTIPLPGDVTKPQLATILLDVATLAVVLAKPLTARLMPIPGKAAGDLVDFDFSYFAPGCVFEPQSSKRPEVLRRLANCYPFRMQERG